MSVREWTVGDLSTIAEIERACFAESWSEETLRDAFSRDNYFALVLETDGKIVGYACGTILFEIAELPRIAVLKEYRGKGFGGVLMERFFDVVKNRGAERVFLEVRVSNDAAIGLYLSRGFEKTRVRKKYYANGEDAVEMKKELS